MTRLPSTSGSESLASLAFVLPPLPHQIIMALLKLLSQCVNYNNTLVRRWFHINDSKTFPINFWVPFRICIKMWFLGLIREHLYFWNLHSNLYQIAWVPEVIDTHHNSCRCQLYGQFESLVDSCCFYYFVRNSLVALLEALCAHTNKRSSLSVSNL